MIDDIAVYVLLDPEHSGGHDLPQLAEACAANGASILQIRDKQSDARETIALAQACIEKAAPFGVPVVINDRVDVAVAAKAQGVHLGQSDVPVEVARDILGQHAIVGLTIKTTHHIDQAHGLKVDYFGLGGVFATQTKNNPSAPIGLDGLTNLTLHARQSQFAGPLAAIAGIDKTNATDVVSAGADGVCVVSAVASSANPGREVAELVEIVQKARRVRLSHNA